MKFSSPHSRSALTGVFLLATITTIARAAEITRSHREPSGKTWSVALSTDGMVKLSDAVPSSGVGRVALRFPRSETPDVEALLKKFRQWSALAEKNAVTAAEKELGAIGEKTLTFRVESDERRTQSKLVVAGEDGTVSLEDARQYLALLAQLPGLDTEMAENKSAVAAFPDDSREVARNEARGRRAELHAEAVKTIRGRFPATRAQYSTLSAEDDAFTSCRPLEDGTWEARGVVQGTFKGAVERRAWAVRLRPRENDSVQILSAEEKPRPGASRVTRASPSQP